MYKIKPISVYPKTEEQRAKMIKAAENESRSVSSYFVNLHNKNNVDLKSK